jgi:broad specificity phosphatase PhoE
MDLIDNYQNQTVIVVTHGWVLNALLDHIFNVGQYRQAYINAENTSVTYLEYVTNPDWSQWQVHFIGQTPHMDVFPDGLVVSEPEV